MGARESCGDGQARATDALLDAALAASMFAARTELEGPSLVLRSTLPRSVGECVRAVADAVMCADGDADGLVDLWEHLVLDRLGPVVRMDEAEPLLREPRAAVALVGRVTPAGRSVQAFMTLAYSNDYGSCGGLTAHHGDSERVVLELEPLASAGPGDVRVRRIYTAAHEDGLNAQNRILEGPTLDELVFEPDPLLGEPRWVLFSSRAKHASYASKSRCESTWQLPCLHEFCSPDDVPDPAAYDLLFPIANAGEPEHPLVTDLGPCGFPGENAWADRPFCGGLGGERCSSSVRDTLLRSPF